MTPEAREVQEYHSFQEFLDKHPNPARDTDQELSEDDVLFGKQLAKRFLRELKGQVIRKGADGE